jgi:3-hydroxybutyryl-CoA dehydrogenase
VGLSFESPVKRVLLIGEIPLVNELAHLCADAGYAASVYLVEDVIGAGGIDRVREDAASADVAVEVMSESIDAKHAIVTALDAALSPDTLLLTSCFSTTATLTGSWLQRPERSIGFAALPPLAKGGLVELAAGLRSQASAIDRAREFLESIGLETAIVKDSVGLVLPRIVCSLINEAATALADGVAEAQDIDRAMRLGTNYPRGPLEWGDLIGLDVVAAVLRGLEDESGDGCHRPASILQQYVRAGWLGKKTGRGFYEYP